MTTTGTTTMTLSAPSHSTKDDWPEYPFRLISSTGYRERPAIPRSHYVIRNAQLMALTHNTIFRGLNAIYTLAPLVSPGTRCAEDLLFYTRCVYEFIHNHHVTEEEVYFPAIEAAAGMPGLMAENVAQHQALEVGLEELRRYVIETTAEEYRARGLRTAVMGLKPSLETHLHEEIPSILDLWDKIGSEQIKKCYQEMHDVAERTSDGFKAGPFVLGCQDRHFQLDDSHIPFPEVPFIAHYVVDYVIARRHAGAWRFNPSDMYGNPRPRSTKSSFDTSSTSKDESLSTWPSGAVFFLLIALLVGYYLAVHWRV